MVNDDSMDSATQNGDNSSSERPSRCIHLAYDKEHSWSPSTTQFEVRSKNYSQDGIKIPTDGSLLELLDVDIVDLVACETRQSRLFEHPDSFARYLRSQNDLRRIIVIVWQLHPRYLVMTYVENTRQDCEASRLLDCFMSEWNSDARAARLKLLPYVHNFRIPGVSLSRPCIISKKITTEFHDGDNLVEVDINVFSSRVARFILSYVESAASSLIIELAFTLEGTNVEELPERVLGGAKMYKIDLARTRKSHYVPLDNK